MISSLPAGYSSFANEFKVRKIFSSSFLAATITVAVGRFS